MRSLNPFSIEVRFQPHKDTEYDDSIIQPANRKYKSLINSEMIFNKAGVLLKSTVRGVSPTEFVTNLEDYGRLKESNDTIFSFGTSKKGKFKFYFRDFNF